MLQVGFQTIYVNNVWDRRFGRGSEARVHGQMARQGTPGERGRSEGPMRSCSSVRCLIAFEIAFYPKIRQPAEP